MPQLREWMLHFPADWTGPQAQQYTQDVTLTMVQTVNPIMQVLGPDRACAVLLTVILNMARANPVYHENIKDGMAKVYDMIEALDPMKGLRKQ